MRGLRPVAVRALRREDIFKHHGMRFPRLGEHRLRVVRLTNADDMPAPRIRREEFLNLPMMTDRKLPLKAFDKHGGP